MFCLSYTLLSKCMMFEDFNRIGFKEILDTLDPDLRCDFKKNAYYHNEFKQKQTVTRKPHQQGLATDKENTIVSSNDDAFDNYM